MSRMSELAEERKCSVKCDCPCCMPTESDYQEMYDLETVSRMKELLESGRLNVKRN